MGKHDDWVVKNIERVLAAKAAERIQLVEDEWRKRIKELYDNSEALVTKIHNLRINQDNLRDDAKKTRDEDKKKALRDKANEIGEKIKEIDKERKALLKEHDEELVKLEEYDRENASM